MKKALKHKMEFDFLFKILEFLYLEFEVIDNVLTGSITKVDYNFFNQLRKFIQYLQR